MPIKRKKYTLSHSKSTYIKTPEKYRSNTTKERKISNIDTWIAEKEAAVQKTLIHLRKRCTSLSRQLKKVKVTQKKNEYEDKDDDVFANTSQRKRKIYSTSSTDTLIEILDHTENGIANQSNVDVDWYKGTSQPVKNHQMFKSNCLFIFYYISLSTTQ